MSVTVVAVIVVKEGESVGLGVGSFVGDIVGATEGDSVQPLQVYLQLSYQFGWLQCPRLYAATHVPLSNSSTACKSSHFVGCEVGETDGDSDGDSDGDLDGDSDGDVVGDADGNWVGDCDGD